VTGVDVKVEAAGGSVRVILVGDVDLANVDQVAAEVHAAITNQLTAATIDLSDVGYLDSAGLGPPGGRHVGPVGGDDRCPLTWVPESLRPQNSRV
jgi:hypothetical protein